MARLAGSGCLVRGFESVKSRPKGQKAPVLDQATTALGFKPDLLRGFRRSRRDPGFWVDRGLSDQFNQAFERLLPVAILAAVAVGFDHQRPFFGDAPVSKVHEPLAQGLRQVSGIGHPEAELHGSRDLIDVLTAWSRGAHELPLEVLFSEVEVGANVDYGQVLNKSVAVVTGNTTQAREFLHAHRSTRSNAAGVQEHGRNLPDTLVKTSVLP
jgi:hypothetical protein